MYKLRDYQQQAVDNTIKYFKKKRDPAVIVLPTGSGKSLVIAELAKIANGRVLVLAHVKELVEQNHAKFESYGLDAGIYSAGLDRKDLDCKVTFGSIQSVARASDEFFQSFSILIVEASLFWLNGLIYSSCSDLNNLLSSFLSNNSKYDFDLFANS